MADTHLDHQGFDALLQRLAAAWAACDHAAAAACFTTDAIYMEPPDRQLFCGRAELTAYFSPLRPGTYLHINGSWFDHSKQTGCCEFSFGEHGRATADHGVAVVAVNGGLIVSWREYHREGPAAFDEFISPDGTDWTWHIGTYP